MDAKNKISEITNFDNMKKSASSITEAAKTKLETEFGLCDFIVFHDSEKKEHLALVFGDLNSSQPVKVRIHSECMTGDTFFSSHCDCGSQLHSSLKQISKAEVGVLIYLRQEGRGIGLTNKIKAYELQRIHGYDTYEANKALDLEEDARGFEIAGVILKKLGIDKIKLLTNNPQKLREMQDMGIQTSRETLTVDISEKASKYISDKVSKHKHFQS